MMGAYLVYRLIFLPFIKFLKKKKLIFYLKNSVLWFSIIQLMEVGLTANLSSFPSKIRNLSKMKIKALQQ
jgi:hypothetical protein